MEPKEFTVRDRLPGHLIITGELLADMRYGSQTKTRWTDLALYKVTDTQSGPDEEPFRYALEIIARSWVYHRVDGPCVKPRHRKVHVKVVRRSPGRWKNLYPCQKEGCKPADLEKMQDTDRIAEERDDTTTYLCTNAADIITKLYRHSGEISRLAASMLRKASGKDPDIAQAMKQPRRV